MDKPTYCERCRRGPAGRIIPIATNRGDSAKTPCAEAHGIPELTREELTELLLEAERELL